MSYPDHVLLEGVSRWEVPYHRQNKKKINSHRWFFNAFGPLIKPNVSN